MSSAKQQKLLKYWVKKNQIKAFLFDFDDTLIDTHLLFHIYINEALNFITSTHTNIDRKVLAARLETINNEAYLKLAVNPNRWEYVINTLVKEFSQMTKKTAEKALEILHKIYTTPPVLFEGVTETLDVFSGLGIQLILVTHASKEWTKYKLNTTGLNKFFPNVVTADENKHKTPDVWLNAIQRYNMQPSEVVVVGDNLKGDIISACSIGITHLFWVDKGTGWKMYREGELPKGAKVITGIGKLVEVLGINS